jgi:hypothetical protein
VQNAKHAVNRITNYLSHTILYLSHISLFSVERDILRLISNNTGQALTEYLLAAGEVIIACAG